MPVHGLNLLDPLGDWPAGLRHVRLWDCGVAWKDLNPAPDTFVWDRLDSILSTARANGIRSVCLVLSGTPQWAASNPTAPHGAAWLGRGSNSPPRAMVDWEKFVWNVATRYRGQISHYQIWNEPQLAPFWYPYSQIDLLAKMTMRASSIIGRVDPDAKIVAAPVLPRASSGGMKRASAYLQALSEYRWPVDVFSAHLYPEIGHDQTRWGVMASNWKVELRSIKAPKLPLWITETNYNLLGGPVSDSDARKLTKATGPVADQLSISRVYWYAYGLHADASVLGIPLESDSPGMSVLSKLI